MFLITVMIAWAAWTIGGVIFICEMLRNFKIVNIDNPLYGWGWHFFILGWIFYLSSTFWLE